MRELGPDNSLYMRVGTQWVKVSPSLDMLFWYVCASLWTIDLNLIT